MRPLAIIPLILITHAATAAPASRIQWSLRFDHQRAHSSALTGCYGTASYQYVLPSLEELKAHRQSLLARAKAAGLGGFAWSATADRHRPNHVFVLDLAKNQVQSRPKLGFPSPKGIVFCRCRRDDLLHCTPSALPALGRPFVTHADGAAPEAVAVWKDPETGLEWHYRWHPVSWHRARPACEGEGERLPTLGELRAAAPRLRETYLGARVRAHGKPVWSADEEADRAWAYGLDSGRESLHPKGGLPDVPLRSRLTLGGGFTVGGGVPPVVEARRGR